MSEGASGPPPGPLTWFPWGQQDLPGWRFDVITLLAIIGESSVAEHAQTLTASSLCLLPRIIPAPQALLRPARPQRLPEVTAKMAGVYGGVILDSVGFFANIMHPLEDFKPFAFKVLEIRHAHLHAKRPVPGILTNLTIVTSEERYTVPAAYYSPVHFLNVFSTLLTIAIIACAAIWRDGTAILAVSLISLAGSVVCYASWWRPLLMNRRTTNKVPRGDVVIRTREGAFLLVKCTEEVARELYSGTEECRYDVRDVTPEDSKRADDTTDPDDPREGTPSFTRTLWYAVRETRHGAWVERSGAMPGTEQWKEWLTEAVDEAWKDNRQWEAVRRKNEIMKDALDGSSPTGMRHNHPADKAEQRAPLAEVQPPRRETQSLGSSTF
ncbi:hypothetical protein N0V88_005364 [Collariella sp. IMI 366227]|nr:hypothetical protein N0V88_005364 [Collariella sp. IMI 366227]